MKNIQNTGLGLFLIGLLLFISLILLGKYEVTPEIFNQLIKDKNIKSELFINDMKTNVVGKEFTNPFSFSSEIRNVLANANSTHIKNKEYGKKIWSKPHVLAYDIAKKAGTGLIKENKGMFWWLTFGIRDFWSITIYYSKCNHTRPKRDQE